MRNQVRDIYRIIDANYNRINEGLRVIEEYFRFITENIDIQKKIKEIRHILFSEITANFDYSKLLEFRDSQNDPGSKYSTNSELDKSSAENILISNFKRIQESLRVLEEYSKLIYPESSITFKKLRFELYEIEKKCCGNIEL
ncbi:thiamine-phosphate pyrophosphorylase [Candidatus Dependentiae bacterium]|nr:thiamine-phosphate pyrophosphorylase [Candidatus Dependentiae bacterium]